MAETSDMMKLYSKRILALASELPAARRLENAERTARKRSPLCGSTVTVDLNLHDDRIVEFGHDVKACALGQASASVVAANVLGRNQSEIQNARSELHAMLTSDGPEPTVPFQQLEALRPAKDYKNRHASVLLTLDAILAAFETQNT